MIDRPGGGGDNRVMERRAFGRTGLEVSTLGLGAGPLGDERLSDDEAVALVHAALGCGIRVIDTAPSYGRSELRLGRALVGRRHEVVLSTKVGYGVAGVPDWTGECVRRGVDAALSRLGCEWLDVVHLHSCPRALLERGEVVDALAETVRAGKVRVAAYSGDGAALEWAVASGRFGSVQCSLSVVDQAALAGALPAARAAGLGVVAKRPLANAAWRYDTRPGAPDVATYWERWRRLRVDELARAAGVEPGELLLRWVLWRGEDGVHVAIAGTTAVANVERLAGWAAKGRLSADVEDAVGAAWRREAADGAWEGVI